MAEGVFQTDRGIFDNKIWQNVLKFRLFFFIYGKAVFSEEGVEVGDIHVKRGQYLRSYRNLQSDLEYMENNAVKKYSLSMIKKAVDELIIEERLQKIETKHGTLFTVVNYEEYQGFERFDKQGIEQRKNGERTEKERRKNNNKNVKNVKNVYKEYSSEIIRMADRLKFLILQNNPNAKTPKDLAKWQSDFDKMKRLDKRADEQIFAVMEFSQKDNFWKSNILSAGKLREKFDTLLLQKDRPKPQQKTGPVNKANFNQRKYTDEDFEKMYTVL